MVVWNVEMLGIVLSLLVYFVSQYLHSVIPTSARFLLKSFCNIASFSPYLLLQLLPALGILWVGPMKLTFSVSVTVM